MEVLSVCPQLIAQNGQGTLYEGFISAKGKDFHVRLSLGAAGKMRGAMIQCEWRLRNLLSGNIDYLQQRLNQSTSLVSFLQEMKIIMERQLELCPEMLTPPPPAHYDTLLNEIEVLGWEHLSYVDENFQELHFEVKDRSQRSHIMKVTLSTQHPQVRPKCAVDFPAVFDFTWSQEVNSLESLYHQFEKCVAMYQHFWDMMDEIDRETWVLEPENPSRAAMSRRIAVGTSASIQITVDAAHPELLPECRFLGSETVLAPFQENLNKSLDKWNPELTVLENLRNVLQVEFPSPMNSKKEEFQVECGICYSHRLGGEIPEQVCGDQRCGQPFHHICLYEWLRGLPNCRQSFNTLFGECPYCSKPLTVPMPVT